MVASFHDFSLIVLRNGGIIQPTTSIGLVNLPTNLPLKKQKQPFM